ncbi:uncharacterized protein LOC143032269 [Oratosquilla oratoria]|uniref:uncharacterized protein LOC143032269 n=1 Tax=Oratosquilla oratoria TaxID=337810 RepID=UPI003F7651C8
MTHVGKLRQSYGGVGRNLADALARLDCHPLLLSAVGNDTHARALKNHNTLMDTSGFYNVMGISTAVYCVILDRQGEAVMGIGDMNIHKQVTPAHIEKYADEIAKAPLVLLDGNMALKTVSFVLNMCHDLGVPVWYEPTDVQKASLPWRSSNPLPAFASPNLQELSNVTTFLGQGPLPPLPAASAEWSEVHKVLRSVLEASTPLLENMRALMVTLGSHGFLLVRRAQQTQVDSPLLTSVDAGGDVVGLHFQAKRMDHIVSVSGAGDCLAAGFIAGMLKGKGVSECAALGVEAAALSMGASPAVPEELTPAALPWGASLPFTLVRPASS